VVWRVACVRIPRFPIGAVWQSEKGQQKEEQQLQLPLPTPTPAPRPLLASVDAPSPRSATNTIPSRARFGQPSAAQGEDEGSAKCEVRSAKTAESSHWDDRCIALIEKNRVRAVSLAAGKLGLRAGMTQSEARSRCADLVTMPWDDVTIARAVTKASGAFLAASPQVSPVSGAPGLWWIGAGGFTALGGERALILALREIARRIHPHARVAVADSCVAARAATWDGGPGSASATTPIVPSGGCAAYLAAVPLALVPMDEELRETLHALGLRTAGALASLSTEDVERRWGDVGLSAWRLARGEDRRRPVLSRTDAQRTVSAELSMSADSMEPVLFLVRPALERLVSELATEGRAAAAVAITLTLDDANGAMPSNGRAHTVTREVRPARPVARVAPLFEQCRSLLASWPLTAPVSAVSVTIAATALATGEQGDLLHTGWRDAAAAEAAFFRLRADLGTESVVRPIARDEHRVDRAGGWVEVSEIQPVNGKEPATTLLRAADDRLTKGRIIRRVPQAVSSAAREHERPRQGGVLEEVSEASGGQVSGDRHAVALRLLESPEPADVEFADGKPCALWWRGGRLTLASAMGPERLTGDWWKEGYLRDYWRCRTSEPGELLIYEEGSDWWVQGWYD